MPRQPFRARGEDRAEGSLARRLEGNEAKRKLFEDRPGPEKAKGEKAGEYRDRIKRHDHVTERQIALTDAHREVLTRRQRKVEERPQQMERPTTVWEKMARK